MKLDIRRELLGVLSPAASFDDNWRKLCWLKEQGVDAADVQRTLEAMYQETGDERVQEGIAELLDCVVGFCTPEYAVWPKE